MSLTFRNLVAISCVLMAGQASAEELAARTYITPSINYNQPQYSDSALDPGWGVGVGVGKAVNQNFNLELNLAYDTQDFKSGRGTGSLKATTLSVDGLYFYDRNANFSPYALAGIGIVHGRAPSLTENHAMGELGIGVMKWMNNIAVRGDIRYRHIPGSDNVTKADDWIATVGLVIPLGNGR